ncbi:MAG TPA: ATP synthase F1 subunit gamma [Kosmotogaceae bacterium]|nr:MAG: ATP synthase gamma chain [Thermotogales bacterium 46_20]HAA85789.1 ATP synthase F1 subunit gamma [Kosmotogaceae bacterium]
MSKGKLRQIKKRIDSTRSTMQITRAMEMVARAKIKKIERTLQYVRMTEKGLRRALTIAAREISELPYEYGEGEVLVVVTSDMGLCGSFNSEILKHSDRILEKEDVRSIVTVGTKAEVHYRHNDKVKEVFSKFYDEPDIEAAGVIADRLFDLMKRENASGLKFVYSRFKSSLAQTADTMRVFPVDLSDSDSDVYDFEPEIEILFEELVTSWVINSVLLAMHETKVGELHARQNAMRNATENAEKMIERLTLGKNKLRQATITQEIIEVVNGAEALRGE